MAGLVGPLVALPLIFAPTIEGDTLADARAAGRLGAARPARAGTVFTPAILGMMVFFVVLSLSTSGLTNFSVPALMNGYHFPFATANLALTVYLTATAFGVLSGGFIADLTRRHGDVAALGFSVNAGLILLIALFGLGPALLVLVMGLAGFLSGHHPAVAGHAGARRRPRRRRSAAPLALSRSASASAARSARCCSAGSWTAAPRIGFSASASSLCY